MSFHSNDWKKLASNQYLEFWYNDRNGYFHLAQKTGGVIVVPIHDQSIMLLEHYRSQLDQTLYEVPRGFLEENEEPMIGAARELNEETNLYADKYVDLGVIHADSGLIDDQIHVFGIQTDDLLRTDLETKEGIISAKWLTIPEYRDLVQNGQITDSMTLSAVSLAISHQLIQ